jgi:M6 family metalloprotease-like protein
MAILGSLLMLAAMLPAAVAPVRAAEEPAGAVASGFLFYRYPTPDPLCSGLGLNVSAGPFFGPNDCGFASFGITGAQTTAAVSVALAGPNGTTFATVSGTYDTVDADWSFPVNPAPSWPAGWITARVSVDGDPAGETTFGHKVLGASIDVDAAGAPYAPGDDVPVNIQIGEMNNVTDLSGGTSTGVAATFSLDLVTPGGDRRSVPGGPFTASSTGARSILIPGSLTADLEGDPDAGFEVTAAIAAVDASYTDPTTGAWAAAEAGTASLELLDGPDRVSLRASYVSSVGWVKPGEGYPFRIFVTNATDAPATNVSVTIAAPPSSSFLDATPLQGGGSASVSASSITWTIGTIPAATTAGPMVRTLVVTARAASLAADPEIVWKDLSTTATLHYTGQPASITSTTHGPKVIPANGGFETARYGDKPFPIVPVEYVDLERQSNETWDNDADKLSTVVNDPGFVGSTFNLYQEMSYGQLFPQGSVPSAGIATADFSTYAPGFAFTTPDRTDPFAGTLCRGATMAEAPGVIGSAAFDQRIQDGWYQLPGTTEYYGGDWPAFTSLTLAIDSACGTLGKSVYDAAQISDPEIDYNQFDSDKDGVVDFFMLIFVGCGGNGASQIPVLCEYFGNQTPWYDNIWPHSSSLEAQFSDPATGLRGYISDDQLKSLHEVPQCWTSTARIQYDDCAADGGTGQDSLPVFVRVGPYNVNPETVFQSASVISHEYGHHLGLPDFYNSGAEVYGDLNLMAADYSQHMTIFSKQELGWVVPEYLQPGDTRTVDDWAEIKRDTGQIHWQRPDGTPYVLSTANGDQNIHNGQAYAVKLPGRQVIDPDLVPSGSHVWYSGRGNDFGCSPTGAHNLDLYLPELATAPAGATVTLEFKSSWDIEWDWDYGFVLTSGDGESYTSQVSENGFTTDSAFNPNRIECETTLNNGITGTSGAWQAGQPTVTQARLPEVTDYGHGAPFLSDGYDISELVGRENPVVRFSYFTDGAFDRPGWFIDDVVVKVNGETIYASDMEGGTEEGRLVPGGCDADGFRVARQCTDGWSRVEANDASTLDHAYYLELRDQSGFDFDGHDQSDRGDTSWQPGLFLEYTDEAHGYGNNGTPGQPAQHYLDSQPIPGSDCVAEQSSNCADVSFTSAPGDGRFSDAVTAAQPGGFVNSFSNPDSSYGDDLWHFDYGCLTLDVTSMTGQGIGPETPATGDLVAGATISAGSGCAPFVYGRGGGAANQPPTADAQARPTTAEVGQSIVFDGSGSTDDRQAASELTYGWAFGDGETATGQTVHHAYATAGEYTATLAVTDGDGATASDTVLVTVVGTSDLVVSSITTVEGTGSGGSNGKPKEGDKVRIRATIQNTGAVAVPATATAFTLDGVALAGSPVATAAIPAGGTATVELIWDTRGVKDAHEIGVTADSGAGVAESDEGNNAATLQITVRGNKVENGSFEQSSSNGAAPEGWTAGGTPAGMTGYSSTGGTDGSKAVTITGTRKSVLLGGIPTWTSSPIAVAPGEVLELQVSVSTDKVSSAPGIGLAYLGAAGELLNTVRLIDVPLVTNGFTTLQQTVTLPPGVAQVRIVLFGFAPTDTRTSGTVTFDRVGLYGM